MTFNQRLDQNLSLIIEDSFIKSPHAFEALGLKLMLIATRDSSWDFPSACIALFPNDKEIADEAPMHHDYEILKTFQKYDPNITDDDLEFDT